MKRWFPQITALLCAVSGMLLFTQCKKNKQDTPKDAAFSKTFLVGKKWRLTAQTINPGMDDGEGHIVTDIYATFPDCMKDDFIEYFADGTGVQDEGVTKCSAESQQRQPFRWNLKDDGTIEGQGDDDFAGTYRAEKINNNSFKITCTGYFRDETAAHQRTMVLVFTAF